MAGLRIWLAYLACAGERAVDKWPERAQLGRRGMVEARANAYGRGVGGR